LRPLLSAGRRIFVTQKGRSRAPARKHVICQRERGRKLHHRGRKGGAIACVVIKRGVSGSCPTETVPKRKKKARKAPTRKTALPRERSGQAISKAAEGRGEKFFPEKKGGSKTVLWASSKKSVILPKKRGKGRICRGWGGKEGNDLPERDWSRAAFFKAFFIFSEKSALLRVTEVANIEDKDL